jgi:hypothetical protein
MALPAASRRYNCTSSGPSNRTLYPSVLCTLGYRAFLDGRLNPIKQGNKMKKLIIATAMALGLVACGGGGTGSIRWDSTGIYNVPYVPGPPARGWAAGDGVWDCVNPDEPKGNFTASIKFSGTEASWSGTWPDILDTTGKPHVAYLQYNDISGNVGTRNFWGEKRPDADPIQGFNVWSFPAPAAGADVGSYKGEMLYTVSVTTDWTKAIATKVWTCTRPAAS